MAFRSKEELENGLDFINNSPKDKGVVNLIVCRPNIGERKILERGELNSEVGLVGDCWKTRGSSRTNNGFGHPLMQINLMNSRVIDIITQDKNRWKWAGDQLFVDLDLSNKNLPIGTKLALGNAIIQITEIPHTGCKKFVERFGLEAMKFVNSPKGRLLNLRGVNAKVIVPGIVNTNDTIKKI